MRTRRQGGRARPMVLVAGALVGCLVALGVVADGTTDAGAPAPPAPRAHAPGARAPAAGEQAGAAGTGPVAGSAQRPRTEPGRPLLIVIPSLGVRAPVVPVRTAERVLVPPADPTTVGWWSQGARPGSARGAAVLTGHTVSSGGGVFDDLDRLRAGATVRLRTTTGPLSYVVDTASTYPQQSLPRHAHRVFDQSAPGRLVLVTCEDWNGQVYRSNHVVTAFTPLTAR